MVYIPEGHVRDCECEDYPCCGHTDNVPADMYCDQCGIEHGGECDDDFDGE